MVEVAAVRGGPPHGPHPALRLDGERGRGLVEGREAGGRVATGARPAAVGAVGALGEAGGEVDVDVGEEALEALLPFGEVEGPGGIWRGGGGVVLGLWWVMRVLLVVEEVVVRAGLAGTGLPEGRRRGEAGRGREAPWEAAAVAAVGEAHGREAGGRRGEGGGPGAGVAAGQRVPAPTRLERVEEGAGRDHGASAPHFNPLTVLKESRM